MDFNNMQTWHYFAIGGAGILVLGIILYFLPVGKMKIPAVITTAFGALGAGLAAGIIFMGLFGYSVRAPDAQTGDPDQQAAGLKMGEPGAPKGKGGGGPGGGAPKGKGGFGGGGGGFGPPPPKMQLVNLVNALDTVVDKPVAVILSPEDRVAIAKELEGLDTASEIKDEDARTKLEAIQKILEKNNRKALETVGYRWAGEPKGGPPKGGFPKDPPPNPFKEGTPAEHLKSLMERLSNK
jgi:hypothetical protein